MGFFIFLFGTVMGSFFNVCIYRIPLGKSVVSPPSSCGSCGERLKGIDMIPVLSYFFLKGRCRHCGEKYSPRYMVVELITGIFYFIIYLKFGYGVLFFKGIILFSILLIIGFIDYDNKIIPDSLNLILLLSGIFLNIFFNLISFKSMGFGFLAGFGFLFLIALIGPMGGGDIKLMGATGVFLGFKYTVMSMFLGFVTGGLISSVLLIFKIVKPKDMIPFGPFLCFGIFTSFLFGNEIFSWYFNTFILG